MIGCTEDQLLNASQPLSFLWIMNDARQGHGGLSLTQAISITVYSDTGSQESIGNDSQGGFQVRIVSNQENARKTQSKEIGW